MTITIFSRFTIVSLFLIFVVFSCTEKKETDDAFANAKEIYSTTCASCHGQQMAMFVDRKWKHGSTVDSIAMTIKNGYIDLGMPSFVSLYSEEQIKELAEYIKYGIDNTKTFTFDNPFNPKDTFTEGDLTYTLELITDSVDAPWGFVFLPDNSMIITDMDGDLYHRSTDGILNIVANAPKVLRKGQGGMLDIELDPDFEQNGMLYISFSKGKMEGEEEMATTAVISAKYANNELTNVQEIFEALPYFSTKHHYGGRLEFDNNKKLFISVGERGKEKINPQSLESACGKIHRINPDGSIPEDNPFYNTEGAVKSIYSYGHRNPQGMIFDATTNTIWEHEHGPRGGDELNIIKKSENYGWPVVSFGINYDGTTFTNNTTMEGMTDSEKYWVPSIAPCGMAQVNSDKYPGWESDLLVGSLRFKYLVKVEMDGTKIIGEIPLLKNIGRVRNVGLDREGFIYVSTEQPGSIYKLIPIKNEI